jgi:F-type H+-transporting ATPase subunit gamma
MTSQRELRRRIATVRSIERTVDALQKISAARLTRERTRVAALRPYTDAVVGLVRELAARGAQHPLLAVREDRAYLLLAIGSDRGMCGAYNASVLRAGVEFIASRRRHKLYLLTAGRKVRRLSPRTRELVVRETLRDPRPLSEDSVARIADDVVTAFLRRDAVRVYLLYTEFRGVTGNRPVVRRILPLMAKPRPATEEPLCEPALPETLDRLLPEYVRAAIRQAFAEASASEQAARMVTMEQAAVSARKMIAGLTRTANRARQAAITRELSDIVGTVEALA